MPATLPPDRIVLAPPMPRLVLAGLPLQGVTLLAVEDSRFASDALRLMCLRSGARLRRAGTLAAARAHLRVYRPDAVLVDLGLPDGRGEDLLRELASAAPRPALLGMSGDPDGRAVALAAGADGFADKPFAGLAAFRRALLPLLPGCASGLAEEGEVTADPAALHDDLARAALALDAGPGEEERRYLSGFLSGLAQQAHDPLLSEASAALRRPGAGMQRIGQLLDARIAENAPFRPGTS